MPQESQGDPPTALGTGWRGIQRPFESGRDSIPLVIQCQGALKEMSTIDELLDAAKAATKSANDSELAKALGIRPAAVSNYRRGVSLPNAVVCATLAGLTGTPLARVLGIVGEARAISSDEKAVWRKLAATAMAVCLAIGFALPHDARAAAQDGYSAGHAIHYAKSWIRHTAAFVGSGWHWLKLWIGSCFPSGSTDKDELAA